MLVKLHANAATTPKVRAYIQASNLPPSELALELGLSETTVRRWKGRSGVADRSSAPHTLASSFSLEEEEIAVQLRTELDLSLDDSLEVMRRCLRPRLSDFLCEKGLWVLLLERRGYHDARDQA